MSLRMANTEEYILEDAGFLYDTLQKIKKMWIVGQQIFGNVCDTNKKKISGYRYEEEAQESDNAFWKRHKSITHDSFCEEDFMDVNGEHPWKLLENVNVNSKLQQMCSATEKWELAVVMNITANESTEAQQCNIEMFIKLANTPPDRLPGWNEGKKTLDLDQFSMAWLAVRNKLGRT